MEINGTKLKAGMAFANKDARRKTSIIISVHGTAGEVSVTPEGNMYAGAMNYGIATKSLVKNPELVERISFTEFESRFKEFVESKAAKALRVFQSDLAREDKARELTPAHTKALRMDILMDVARGGDVDEALRRLEAMIAEEKYESREEGFEDGHTKGIEDSYDYTH